MASSPRVAAPRGGAHFTHRQSTPSPSSCKRLLDDFYVAYQLNVYTDGADEMANTYAELHQNIQDSSTKEASRFAPRTTISFAMGTPPPLPQII